MGDHSIASKASQDNKGQYVNAYKYPGIKCDSYPRSQCAGGPKF